MPKLAPGQLSLHPTKGYRLSCGWYMKDGKKTPKVFWLGKDKNRAILEAQKIRWSAPIAAFMGGWTKDYERQIRSMDSLARVREQFQAAERLRQTLAPHLPAEVVIALPEPSSDGTRASATGDATVAPSTAVKAAGPMLHAGLDAYVAAVEQQPGSRAYKDGIRDSIEAIQRYRNDCPLAEVDYAWLESFTSYLKGRPPSRKRSKATGQREPIKPYTVKRLLQHGRQAFQWVHRQRASDRYAGWSAPAEWEALFAVELKQIMTKQERDKAADGPEQLTVAEIKRLYHAARDSVTDLHPIVFLMGLFTAQGQSELSCTRRDEIDLSSATFTHRRNKTGQKGVYWLPPELVKMLKAYFKEHPAEADGLAFRTREGQPLVTDKSDAVRQGWDDWRTRAEVERPGVGFYALRRFFGDYATRHGGDAAGDAALAHTAKSVRGKHYSGYRDFAKVEEIGRQLHNELKRAGMFRTDGKGAAGGGPATRKAAARIAAKPRRRQAVVGA